MQICILSLRDGKKKKWKENYGMLPHMTVGEKHNNNLTS